MLDHAHLRKKVKPFEISHSGVLLNVAVLMQALFLFVQVSTYEMKVNSILDLTVVNLHRRGYLLIFPWKYTHN